jgi:hypothetical protein
MSSTKVIRMVGGPEDGRERVVSECVNMLEFHERMPVQLLPQDVELARGAAVEVRRHYYLEHRRWPDLFVWEGLP